MAEVTLQQVVDSMPDDIVLYIGSKCGFFFIGTKKEYELFIDCLSEDAHENLAKLVEQGRHTKELYGDAQRLRKMVHDGKLTSETAVTLINRIINLPENEKNLKDFKPFRERFAVSEYGRQDTDDFTIIVLGGEIGRYWLREEFRGHI